MKIELIAFNERSDVVMREKRGIWNDSMVFSPENYKNGVSINLWEEDYGRAALNRKI